ncbi:hypothetical protein MMC19_000973 [Ptychographa xylographoides]|nr:hypothetical protein [Ptychographa xylographoides]
MDPPSPRPTLRSSFPQEPEEFDADARVSFSKVSNKFILEADDGQEYEYDDALKRWVPVLDDALLEQQSQAYRVEGVDESEPALPPKKKRKQEYINGQDDESGRASLPTKKVKPTPEARERKNTAIYITNLPLDASSEEVQSVFSKCGVIAEEIDHGKPRIKLYTDEQGRFKGDALILYFRPESVELAIQMLDDTDFRFGQGVLGGKMRVGAAEWKYKVQKEGGGGAGGGGGSGGKGGGGDRKKIIRKTQKLNSKLADWDDDDPSAMPDTGSRWDKVVILKHMFTLAELEEDPAAILDIKEDIRDECAKIGDVTNVVLFDREPDGVASVRFSTEEAARGCVQVMNGRFFAGTQVVAYVATGNEGFAKSNSSSSKLKLDVEVDGNGVEGEGIGEGEGEGDGDGDGDSRRLDQFGSWLEGNGEGSGSRSGNGEGSGNRNGNGNG